MKIIGHRGAKGLVEENTLASMKEALRHKVDGIEFDVRVSRDKVPVIFHDPMVIGRGGDILHISGTDYSKLKIHIPDLATLDEVLKSFYGKTELFIEIKPSQPLEPIFKILKKYGTKKILIGSFDIDILLHVRRHFPEVGIFVNERWSGVRAAHRARKLKAQIIDLNSRALWSWYIRAVKLSGFQPYTYNLDDPKKAKKWAKAGLAGVITNYPDRFTR